MAISTPWSASLTRHQDKRNATTVPGGDPGASGSGSDDGDADPGGAPGSAGGPAKKKRRGAKKVDPLAEWGPKILSGALHARRVSAVCVRGPL